MYVDQTVSNYFPYDLFFNTISLSFVYGKAIAKALFQAAFPLNFFTSLERHSAFISYELGDRRVSAH